MVQLPGRWKPWVRCSFLRAPRSSQAIATTSRLFGTIKATHGVWVLVAILIFLLLFTRRPHPPQKPQPCIPAPTLPTMAPPVKAIALWDGKLTFYLDPRVYYDFFPHLQRYQCRELISNDALCQGPPGAAPLLLLAIKSHPASGRRRATLRRTWAQPVQVRGFRLQPVFLVAASPDVRHAHLVQENQVFADILMWDFKETHQNLSLKERCFLQWAHEHCQQAAYVFKGDDDILVNVEAVTRFLQQTPNASDFIHGFIQYHSKVVRRGKYAVSPLFYPMDRYPHFASGAGFIMSRSSVLGLYRASLWLPVFPLDDIYLGFLTLAAGISHRHDERFYVWGPPRDELEVYRESLTVHGFLIERLEQVWEELYTPQQCEE